MPTPDDIIENMERTTNRWVGETGQAAGLLFISKALEEKNRNDLLRIKLDIIKNQADFDRTLHHKLVNDITTELS